VWAEHSDAWYGWVPLQRVKTPIDVFVSSYKVFVYKAHSVGSVIHFAFGVEPTDTIVRTEALLCFMYLCVRGVD